MPSERHNVEEIVLLSALNTSRTRPPFGSALQHAGERRLAGVKTDARQGREDHIQFTANVVPLAAGKPGDHPIRVLLMAAT